MSGSGDITGDEFIRNWFAQSQGLDIGSVDRSTFLNLKDFEKMLTGPVAQSLPGSFDPAAFQPIVTGYDEVVLPQRTLFNEVMLSDGPEQKIAELLESGLTPMAIERQSLAERRDQFSSENVAAGIGEELDKDQEAQAVAEVGKMVAFAERLYSEKMDYNKAVRQLSPDVAQYAAANPGAGLYRRPITEESPAAKFYTERGLPTPDQEWTIDDVSPGYSERQAGRDRLSDTFREFQAETRQRNAADRAARAALDKRLREQSWDTYKASKASEASEAKAGTAAGQRLGAEGPRGSSGDGSRMWGQEGERFGSLNPANWSLGDEGDEYVAPPDHGDGAGMIGQRGELFGSVNPVNWSMFGGEGSAGQKPSSSSRAVKAVPSASGMWRQAQANHDAKKYNERFNTINEAVKEAADERRAAFEELLKIRNADEIAQGAELTRANGELHRRNRQGLTPLTYAMQQATSSGSRGGGGGGGAADIVAAWNAKGAAAKANRSGLHRQASGGGMSPIVAALLARSGR